jgi:cytochrome c-type biogenesis protein CcmH/NrfG
LKTDPKNREALFFLAQAYEGKGDKAKAIQLFEECKKVVDDPSFSKEIDQKINLLK